ncbi:MAG: DUF3592 domain-containing protein [Nitrospinae bacterium]|nr:DUF3592 domain-containing protein [Nitrospinota bacterium]
MSKVDRWLLVLIMCGVFGMPFLYSGVSTLIRGYMAGKWPTTTGKVIERTTLSHGKTHSRAKPGRDTYGPFVTYSYTVGDNIYKGNILSDGTYYYTTAEAQAAADAYPAEVTVSYNPLNPGDSTIVKGTPWFTGVFCLIVGTLFFSIGAWAAFKGGDN